MIILAVVLFVQHSDSICFIAGGTSLVETPVPASYIEVEKAVTKVSKKLEKEEKYPVLDEKRFR